MDREQVRMAVRVIMLVLTRICRRTRTQADDLMASILQANEGRIVDAVTKLLDEPNQPPTDEQVVEALRSIGMDV